MFSALIRIKSHALMKLVLYVQIHPLLWTLADLSLHRMAEHFVSSQIMQSSAQSTSTHSLSDKITVSLHPYVDQHRCWYS